MKVAFRVNGSSKIGLGHVMRCLTLAELLRETMQAQPFFMLNDEIPSVIIERLVALDIDYLLLTELEQETGLTDAKACIHYLNQIGEIVMVVVDHYGLDMTWESLVRKATPLMMVIDDLANRQHDCDLLLNQNLMQNAEQRYQGLLPPHCRVLLGPSYALVNKPFMDLKKKGNIRENCRQVLVSFGGSDPTKETIKVLDMIEANRVLFSNIVFTVIAGAANANAAVIQSRCRSLPNVKFIPSVSNMAEYLSNTDLVIGAGGISLIERACLGTPSLVICVASNQEESILEGERRGILINLGKRKDVSIEHIAQKLQEVMFDFQLRLQISSRCQELMSPLLEQRTHPIVGGISTLLGGDEVDIGADF